MSDPQLKTVWVHRRTIEVYELSETEVPGAKQVQAHQYDLLCRSLVEEDFAHDQTYLRELHEAAA